MHDPDIDREGKTRLPDGNHERTRPRESAAWRKRAFFGDELTVNHRDKKE